MWLNGRACRVMVGAMFAPCGRQMAARSRGLARSSLFLMGRRANKASLAEIAPDDRFTLLRSVKQRGSSLPQAPNLRSTPLLTPPHHRFEQIVLPVEVARVRPDLLHCPDFIPPFHRTCPAVVTVHDLGF